MLARDCRDMILHCPGDSPSSSKRTYLSFGQLRLSQSPCSRIKWPRKKAQGRNLPAKQLQASLILAPDWLSAAGSCTLESRGPLIGSEHFSIFLQHPRLTWRGAPSGSLDILNTPSASSRPRNTVSLPTPKSLDGRSTLNPFRREDISVLNFISIYAYSIVRRGVLPNGLPGSFLSSIDCRGANSTLPRLAIRKPLGVALRFERTLKVLRSYRPWSTV